MLVRKSRDQSQPFPWRLFWLLLAAGIFGALAIVPFGLEIFGSAALKGQIPPLPLPLLIAIGISQNLILLGLMIWIGLKLSRKVGLGAPLLESALYGVRSEEKFATSVKWGLFTGVAVGVVLLICLLGLVPYIPNLPFVTAAKLALWKRFLACFSGGLYEEILTRLFLLTLLAWLANRSWREQADQLSPAAFWFANFVVAILFGLGHLPSASLVISITPLVVAAALMLNGIAAIAFGYLYWKRGLEAAMIAHFTADFVIYVVGASLLRN